MRKYYIFYIQNEAYDVYRYASDLLYNTLENLHNIEIPHYDYGISVYKQICEPFPVEIIENYFHDRFIHQSTKSDNRIFLLQENTLITFRYSCITVQSTTNFPSILPFFHYFSDRLFICDFHNQDYFWIEQYPLLKQSTPNLS